MQQAMSIGLVSGMLCLSAGTATAQNAPDQRGKSGAVHKQRSQSVANPHSPEQLPAVLAAEELLIAQRVHTGTLPCELGLTVSLQPDQRAPGYFRVQGPGFRYHMRPVSSRTGVIRLEDHKAGAVWLQLADKSMLMDQKKGRRMADACAHPEQVAYAADMKNNPPPALFETEPAGRKD